jgi:cell division protein FtsW
MKIAKRRYEAFLYFFGYLGLSSMLILVQPNMSNAGLVLVIGTIMYYISGADIKPLFYIAPVVILLGALFILVSPYRRERFITMVSPGQQSSQNESYQSEQILIGLGSGGAFGVGVGQSKQKQHYLPEVIGDSIFAIIGEEMGFLGSIIVVTLFAFLTLEMIKISSIAVTMYEKMVGVGICAWVFFQYLINLYATIGLIPFTGMPIPFISYGGSSMVFALMGLGLISNIYRRQNQTF